MISLVWIISKYNVHWIDEIDGKCNFQCIDIFSEITHDWACIQTTQEKWKTTYPWKNVFHSFFWKSDWVHRRGQHSWEKFKLFLLFFLNRNQENLKRKATDQQSCFTAGTQKLFVWRASPANSRLVSNAKNKWVYGIFML